MRIQDGFFMRRIREGGAWARSRGREGGREAVAVDDVMDERSTGEANGM